MVEVARCRICSNIENTIIQNTYYKIDSSEINLVKCSQCGLIYLNPQPNEFQLKELYSDEYFIKWYSSESKRKFSKDYFNSLINKKRLPIHKECSLLDIGCGMGFFLEVANERKCNVKGVELSEFASKYCKEELGFNVHYGSLKSANYNENSFDVITAFDVLEHLNELKNFLSVIYGNLKENGKLIVIVPNYNSLVFKFEMAISKIKKATIPNVPEHLTYFTKKSLQKLLEDNQFKVTRITTIDANDEGERFKLHGNFLFKCRAVLTTIGFYIGKIINQRDALLAISEKI